MQRIWGLIFEIFNGVKLKLELTFVSMNLSSQLVLKESKAFVSPSKGFNLSTLSFQLVRLNRSFNSVERFFRDVWKINKNDN